MKRMKDTKMVTMQTLVTPKESNDIWTQENRKLCGKTRTEAEHL